MKIFRLLFFISIVSIITATCSEDDDIIPVYDVPEEYQSIVEKFVEEAALRGFDLTIDNLIIYDDPDMKVNLCGSCNSNELNTNIQKIVKINQRYCWINQEQKEGLIFHEFGHCILGRLHTSELLPNGDFKSLMAPNEFRVYSPCVYLFDNSPDVCNNVFKRDYYIDELFDATTPAPDWSL